MQKKNEKKIKKRTHRRKTTHRSKPVNRLVAILTFAAITSFAYAIYLSSVTVAPLFDSHQREIIAQPKLVSLTVPDSSPEFSPPSSGGQNAEAKTSTSTEDLPSQQGYGKTITSTTTIAAAKTAAEETAFDASENSASQANQAEKQLVNTLEPNIRHANVIKKRALVAIIIDDVGYRYIEGMRTLELDPDITIAVLPFTPHAYDLAHHAGTLGVEVMLHAPMEPNTNIHWGEGLNGAMNQSALRNSFAKMLDSLPNVRGVNNHMGSGLTTNSNVMEWFMSEVSQHNLYFIDSMTTPRSKAWAIAQKHNIPSYKRDVFLDNEVNDPYLEKQFSHMIRIAQKHGYALAIGHPYKETLTYLEKNLPRLRAMEIDLVPVSTLLTHLRQSEQLVFAKRQND